jgi:predicted TIM-barrel fold metal-dependent hydrolase
VAGGSGDPGRTPTRLRQAVCVQLARHPRDERAVRPVASELLDLFGPQRCMVGSNFPVERLAGDFSSLYELVLSCLRDLPGEQRADVLSGTARRFYRIPHPDSARYDTPR